MGFYPNTGKFPNFYLFLSFFRVHSWNLSLRFDYVFFLKVVSFIEKKRNSSILIKSFVKFKTFNFIYHLFSYCTFKLS